MFPRPSKITRLLLAAILVVILIITINMGGSSTPSVEFVSIDRMHLQSSGKSTNVDAASGDRAKRLGLVLTMSQNTVGVTRDGETGGAKSFVQNVKYRLDTAGLRAIREMQSIEARMEVKPPVPPINPHDFRYIHNPSQICASQPSLNFLIYVHSAPANLKRRQIIRQTWGNPQLLSLFNASMVFALGATVQTKVQKSLEMEFEEYADLLQEDYMDSYRNLTYKGMSALKWAYKFCRQPLFFIKTDDDILLDIVSIIDHILTKTVPARGAKKLVLCNVWTTMKVIRDPKSKWGLSKEEFSYDIFPPYCSGSAFIMSGDMIPLMFHTALRSKFFWVDDYFISGVLVNTLGVKHERFNEAYLLNGLQVEEKLVDSSKFMILHLKNYPLFFKAWHLLMKRHAGMSAYLQKFTTLNSDDIKKGFAGARKWLSLVVNSTSPSMPSSEPKGQQEHRLQGAKPTNETKSIILRSRPAMPTVKGQIRPRRVIITPPNGTKSALFHNRPQTSTIKGLLRPPRGTASNGFERILGSRLPGG